jgi:DNA-binding PucR family transcriptional regulator
LEPIKFNFPKEANANFAELKERLKNFKKAKTVDDREDADYLVQKYNLITDQTSEVLDKIVPKL